MGGTAPPVSPCDVREQRMPRILLAVDGSECALRAPRKLIETIAVYRDAPDVDLVTVHLPVPRVPNMGLLVSEEMIQRYYAEECTKDRVQCAFARRSNRRVDCHASESLEGRFHLLGHARPRRRIQRFFRFGRHGAAAPEAVSVRRRALNSGAFAAGCAEWRSARPRASGGGTTRRW